MRQQKLRMWVVDNFMAQHPHNGSVITAGSNKQVCERNKEGWYQRGLWWLRSKHWELIITQKSSKPVLIKTSGSWQAARLSSWVYPTPHLDPEQVQCKPHKEQSHVTSPDWLRGGTGTHLLLQEWICSLCALWADPLGCDSENCSAGAGLNTPGVLWPLVVFALQSYSHKFAGGCSQFRGGCWNMCYKLSCS